MSLFGGSTFEPERDGERLHAQLKRVFHLMEDGRWRTLQQISEATGDPPASVSARLRDFRKDKFGGHTVERQYVSRGLFRYRLIVNGNRGETARTAKGSPDNPGEAVRRGHTGSGFHNPVENT